MKKIEAVVNMLWALNGITEGGPIDKPSRKCFEDFEIWIEILSEYAQFCRKRWPELKEEKK